MKKMNCKDIQRKLRQYIDNRIRKERSIIETHIKSVFSVQQKRKIG